MAYPNRTRYVSREVWLPGRNASRTNSRKLAWETTPYFSRAYNKGRLFVKGAKPKELAHISKISQRRWHRYRTDCNRENPILKGLECLRLFEDESVTNYAQASEKLGVSRQRVYQLVSLVTKLPSEITDLLLGSSDPAILRYFTERRLRPLITLPSDAEKMSRFKAMWGEAEQGFPGACQIC